MKNTIKVLGIIALAAVIGLSMVGCKNDDDGGGLPAPTGLNVWASGTTINATWNPVSGASGYTLYVSADNFRTYESGNTYQTSYSESGVSSGTYYFQVSAFNASGESARSNVVSVSVGSGSGGGSVLPAPTGLRATASGTTINVTWNSVTGASGYTLYASADNRTFKSGNTSQTSYSESGVSSGTYYFKVSAYNANGEGAISNVVSVTVSGGTQQPSPSLDGVWEISNGTRVTVSGTTGVFSYFGTLNALWTNAIDKGTIKIGDQYWRNLKSTGDLTWSGEQKNVTFNNSKPTVPTGTSWRNATFTMSANRQTVTVISADGSGTITGTWTRRQ